MDYRLTVLMCVLFVVLASAYTNDRKKRDIMKTMKGVLTHAANTLSNATNAVANVFKLRRNVFDEVVDRVKGN